MSDKVRILITVPQKTDMRLKALVEESGVSKAQLAALLIHLGLKVLDENSESIELTLSSDSTHAFRTRNI